MDANDTNKKIEIPNNHWVAFETATGNIIAVEPTIGKLMDNISEKNIEPAMLTIGFHTTDAV